MNEGPFFIITKTNVKHNSSVEIYCQFPSLTVEIDSAKDNVFPAWELLK